MDGTLVTRSPRTWPKDENTKSRSENRVDCKISSLLVQPQIRRTAFPRQRDQLPPRIQSSTSALVAANPPPPPTEIKYLFAVAIAIGHWPSEDALECRFEPLENKANAEIGGNRDLVFSSFMSFLTRLGASLFRQHSATIEAIGASL